jgi:hypothetical protein
MNPFLRTCVLATTASSSLLLSPAALAADPTELEARIDALESAAADLRRQSEEMAAALQAARAEIARLQEAAATPPAAPAAEPFAPPPPLPPPTTSTAASANAFNPAISLVLNGEYAHHSLDPESYARAGFPLAGEAGPGADGLSLGETEIALSANIDDRFYGQVTLAVESEDGEDELGIEEAFIDASGLPGGVLLRAGRFFSNIGYLNNHHTHTDSFPDRPLPYQAFLGNHYIDDGVQLRWLAPTDLFLELGGELLRGQSFPAGGASHDGVGATTVFAHAGGDVGLEHSWLAGISVLDTEVTDGEDGFAGDARLWIADFTWKWAPDGNLADGGVQVRGEWIRDEREGVFIDADDPTLVEAWDGTRHGAYLEGVYRFDRRWEAGYRYDWLRADRDGPVASEFDPDRHGVVLTWRNSEFSLVRLLLSRDRPNPDDTDTALLLQYQAALGAHGAHKF